MSPYAYAYCMCKHPCAYAYACVVRVNQAYVNALPRPQASLLSSHGVVGQPRSQNFSLGTRLVLGLSHFLIKHSTPLLALFPRNALTPGYEASKREKLFMVFVVGNMTISLFSR